MLVIDTSVLLAAADSADPDHEACAQAIADASPLITTPLVIAEAAYLIRRQLGVAAEAAFFRAVAAGELQVEPLTPADGRRIADIDRLRLRNASGLEHGRRDVDHVPARRGTCRTVE